MQKKLFLSYFAIILIAIGISVITFWSKGYSFITKQSENYYLTQAKLVADIFINKQFTDKQDYHEFVREYADKYNFRITIVDTDGEVYADSGTDEVLENHAKREEIARALKGESVTVNRYSKTMGQKYSYSAVPVSNENFSGVLRVSLPLSAIKALNNDLVDAVGYAIVLCFIIALIAAIIFMELLSKPINEVTKAAVRISEGDYGTKIYTREKNQVGKLAGAFNVMTTSLKETVESLTQRNAELEAMLSSMTAGVVAIDDSNNVLIYNKAFTDITKLVNQKVEGISLYNLIRNAAVFEAVDHVKEHHTSITKEGTLLVGGYRNVRVTATPLCRESEKWFGVLVIIEDITQMKKLETMRTDFVSNVTHELKTPLTSIRGFIDTLKNGAIKDETVANKFLDIIDIEAERLYSLIQDILLLSEIESKREAETVECNMNQIVREVIELLEPKLPMNISLIYNPESYIKPFNCNPDRMKQLFINLLDNAMKYTEEGTITFVCKEEDNNLIINVKDTGIGMEKEHLSRIFERFYRVDKGRSRKQGGTGLGLSIVKHIVESYKGKIHVESKPGEGTEFEIKLPYTE